MDARSAEILEQLKAEVMFPWDRRGDREGGYNVRPQRPGRLGMTLDDYNAAQVEYAERYANIAPRRTSTSSCGEGWWANYARSCRNFQARLNCGACTIR